MKLNIIFGQLDDNAPEALECWDEYCEEGNPDGWEEALKKAHERTQGPNKTYDLVRVMVVEVPDSAVDDLFKVPVVKGKVVKE